MVYSGGPYDMVWPCGDAMEIDYGKSVTRPANECAILELTRDQSV